MKNIKVAGFTLIELLVVISIIGVLSSVTMSSMSAARAKARDAKRMAELRQIKVALERYYNANGYYPPSSCGWDCNGYWYSYDAAHWASFTSHLAPYMSVVPKDPVNSPACAPWGTGCYTYAYGNVRRSGAGGAQYDLTTQLEDQSSPYRCAVKQYKFYFDNQPWCGPYSPYVYEAS